MQHFYKKKAKAEIFLKKTESIKTGMLEVDNVHCLQTSNIPHEIYQIKTGRNSQNSQQIDSKLKMKMFDSKY